MELNIGSDTVDIPRFPAEYENSSVLDPVKNSYKVIEVILGQDVYHCTRPLEYLDCDSKYSPVTVRLPIGWVISGTLPYSSGLVSTCFKAVNRQENDLADQLKSWYDMESYGAMKSVDSRSAADRQANDILEQTTVLKDGRYHVGMLWLTRIQSYLISIFRLSLSLIHLIAV